MSKVTKEKEIMDFLHQRVFNPILDSPSSSNSTKMAYV